MIAVNVGDPQKLPPEEWRARFLAHIVAKLMAPPSPWELKESIGAALAEYDAVSDISLSAPDYMDETPEESADECLSYWGDGE